MGSDRASKSLLSLRANAFITQPFQASGELITLLASTTLKALEKKLIQKYVICIDFVQLFK